MAPHAMPPPDMVDMQGAPLAGRWQHLVPGKEFLGEYIRMRTDNHYVHLSAPQYTSDPQSVYPYANAVELNVSVWALPGRMITRPLDASALRVSKSSGFRMN
ncbi:unnamed protein product [Sphagnum balticum]